MEAILSELQNELKRIDPNGWETLSDAEQSDVDVLCEAIAYVKSME